MSRAEERMSDTRTLSFVHRLHRAGPGTAQRSFILFHGTGGDEGDLIPLARAINPDADALGLRGRDRSEGVNRWYRRMGVDRFDQDQIRAETEAMVQTLPDLLDACGIDPARAIWLGFSNGANFLTALMARQPGLVRQAVLLRAMLALDNPAPVDLRGARVLMLTGAADPYGRYAPALAQWLRASGATLDEQSIPAGHGLSQADMLAMRDWFA
jgi:phospholipase/carboxylesterase